jgi:colicin import membrane protein
MNDKTATTGTTAKPEADKPEADKKEPTVKANRDKYVDTRSASGAKSLSNGDEVAVAIQGFDLKQVYTTASGIMGVPVAELEAKYKHLNTGMQRMNLGNRIRGKIAAIDKANTNLKEGEKPTASGIDQLTKITGPVRKEVDAAAAKVAAEKKKADDAKSAKKAEEVKKNAEKPAKEGKAA